MPSTCLQARARTSVRKRWCCARPAYFGCFHVSGVKKLHALIGGFHLGPAAPIYTDQVVTELKTFEPDVVVPVHCSGQTFVDSVQKMMPDKLLLSSAAARLNFGA
jgi:7,8-dihydropterin-6-yl-methyl-4-(beta-D-ribofuranosyl)aminobenzene 5'-phosphate synthase